MPRYIFCDIEATGNREQDRIIQLGLMVFENNINSDPMYISNELNSTDADMMSEAMELHNITPDMIRAKKKLHDTEGYQTLQRLNLPENIFVAHDATSDLKMLQKEGFGNKMKIIDTLRCSKHLFGDLGIYRLQFLRYELQLYQTETIEANKLNIDLRAHDAISDAIITKILLLKLAQKAKEKFGLDENKEIFNKLIELSSTPVLLKKFMFGKYKGEYIDEIVHSDYGYMRWMRDTLKLDEDMQYTLDQYLA